MKKLLVAAIGAAAAIGAFADPWYSGTSFESNDISIGDLDLTDGEGLNWTTNGASTLAVRSIAGEYAASLRAEYFQEIAEQTMTKGLSIKTKFGEPAYRESDKTKTAMGEVYVDVLVKPTICDDDPTTIGNDAKIAIWLKETESPAATNLMITAGYIDSLGNVVRTNYNCGTYGSVNLAGAADAWQRFTIKSFATIKNGETWPAFVVFRNGVVVGSSADKCEGTLFNELKAEAAAYHRNGCLFPSLVQEATISAIGFDGTGDVDDILFTDVVPSFARTTDVALTWDSHVTGFTYTVGSISVVKSNLSGAGSETITLDAAADIVVTGISYAADYTNDVFTASENIGKANETANTVTFQIANLSNLGESPTCGLVSKQNIVYMTVDGVEYTDIVQAIAAVNDKTGISSISLNTAITGQAIVLNGPNLTGVTLDLNGQSITYDGAGYAITASKPLTIIDSATGGSITADGVVTNTTGLLTISAGTFNGKVAIGGTAAITGGTFTGTVAAESATGFITGGTFANNPTAYLAPGYGYEVVDLKYVVGQEEYTITYYDGEDQLNPQPTPANYVIGDEISPTAPTKAGYTFAGWTWYLIPEEGDPEEITYVAGTTVGNLALVASWTQDIVTYTVTVAAPGANVSVEVSTNGVQIGTAGGNYTVVAGSNVSVEYSAAPDYKLSGTDTFTFDNISANQSTTAPTATACVYYTAVSLNKATTSIETNLTETLVATFTPASAADDSYTWASSAPAIATVDQNGVVTAVAAGEATITVTATHDSSVTASCTVTVTATEPTPSEPTIDPDSDKPAEVAGDGTENAQTIANSVSVTIPDAAKAYTTSEDYQANFDKTATYNTESGKWEVTAKIAATVEETAAETAAAILTEESTTGKVTVPAGLYYKVTRMINLGTPIDELPIKGISDGKGVSVGKPGSTQGFIQVEIGTGSID